MKLTRLSEERPLTPLEVLILREIASNKLPGSPRGFHIETSARTRTQCEERLRRKGYVAITQEHHPATATSAARGGRFVRLTEAGKLYLAGKVSGPTP